MDRYLGKGRAFCDASVVRAPLGRPYRPSRNGASLRAAAEYYSSEGCAPFQFISSATRSSRPKRTRSRWRLRRQPQKRTGEDAIAVVVGGCGREGDAAEQRFPLPRRLSGGRPALNAKPRLPREAAGPISDADTKGGGMARARSGQGSEPETQTPPLPLPSQLGGGGPLRRQPRRRSSDRLLLLIARARSCYLCSHANLASPLDSPPRIAPARLTDGATCALLSRPGACVRSCSTAAPPLSRLPDSQSEAPAGQRKRADHDVRVDAPLLRLRAPVCAAASVSVSVLRARAAVSSFALTLTPGVARLPRGMCDRGYKPAAATSNGGGGVVGPAGVTTASRRKRSSAASQLLPVNGTALLTHPASDIKLERLSPESDTASPQSSPSPARVFPPGLGFVLGLRPGLVPGHPFPPGVIAAAAAQAAVDRQTLAAPALKQVEMMTRNYSDFMRSLAAKYNNPTGQDGGRMFLARGLLQRRSSKGRTGEEQQRWPEEQEGKVERAPNACKRAEPKPEVPLQPHTTRTAEEPGQGPGEYQKQNRSRVIAKRARDGEPHGAKLSPLPRGRGRGSRPVRDDEIPETTLWPLRCWSERCGRCVQHTPRLLIGSLAEGQSWVRHAGVLSISRAPFVRARLFSGVTPTEMLQQLSEHGCACGRPTCALLPTDRVLA
ncbi:hypothetical protein HPB48_002728 [Haemaphysalis longicornis]|uniref:Uncharacterized protein n=1 Tax=Haemaphysalis longicornis TaxID=44386 RepID=A0A9J6GMX9_HAELO|nr:hypothetical protein HPB48_002728 [Haemaphysalis longicornis]